MFYTDGVTVYDHNHVMMPDGDSIAGGTSATQSALIVQDPGNNMLYYIFTVENESPTSNFNYSIVDMTLNSNNGDVSVKNVFLLSPVAEKLTAVKHANGNDVWVMIHGNGNNSYYAWLVTAGGVSVSPVISNIGPVVALQSDLRGQIKFSPDGTKFASAVNGNNYVDLFDFDPATGIVSDEKYLNMPSTGVGQGAYGLEFSASSHYLYSGLATPSQIFQWDISSDSAAIINASRQQIGTSSSSWLGSFQLGPDSKIYIAKYQSSSIGVINDPEVAGAACNYVDNAITFSSATSQFGLTNFVTSYFLPSAITGNNQPLHFSIYPNPFSDKAILTLPPFLFNQQSTVNNQQLFIYDVTGNKIKQIPVTSQTTEIKKENLSSGIYFYRVIIKNEILKGKLLVE